MKNPENILMEISGKESELGKGGEYLYSIQYQILRLNRKKYGIF